MPISILPCQLASGCDEKLASGHDEYALFRVRYQASMTDSVMFIIFVKAAILEDILITSIKLDTMTVV